MLASFHCIRAVEKRLYTTWVVFFLVSTQSRLKASDAYRQAFEQQIWKPSYVPFPYLLAYLFEQYNPFLQIDTWQRQRKQNKHVENANKQKPVIEAGDHGF